jgi:hypothetical protein
MSVPRVGLNTVRKEGQIFIEYLSRDLSVTRFRIIAGSGTLGPLCRQS